ncbi:MAG TPA: ATP-dependent DNA ligase [Verrucomicrobiae bacterium]
MSALEFQFREGGIYFPHLRLWLDPHWPKDELVFVSHAHSDHTADHREVILSEPTARLMTARMGGKRIEHALRYNELHTFQRGGNEFRITLVPAGHIFGSAMSLLEWEGESLLFTGDFKLRRGRSAEACQPVRADTLIMETTFGRPQYRFPPTEEVLQGVVRFCKEALDNDETAVLYGYSLGKSQEILCSLADAGLPIVLHGTVFNMTKVYEQFGHCFPAYEKYEAGNTQNKVLLCPPNVAGSAMLRNLGKTRCAVLTGWAVDPGCKYQYRCDAAFPLSDHADFPDLIEFVKQVQPKRVHTLHGFAGDFAATLRGLGFEASALSEDEQMTLGLNVQGPRSKGQDAAGILPGSEREQDAGGAPIPILNSPPSTRFSRFAETCAAIAGTPGKLEKVRLLAEYLRSLERDCVPLVTIWFTGLPFAPGENRVLQVGWALLRDTLCTVVAVNEQSFHHVYLKHSDLGETASELFAARAGRVRGSMSIAEVQALFDALQSARGPSAKLPVLVRAFEQGSPLEIKFLVKIITSDLRIGLKEGLVEEAVAKAFNAPPDDVRSANLLLGNIGETAKLALENRLREAGVQPFRPVKFMLASPEETAVGIWERLVGEKKLSEKMGKGAVEKDSSHAPTLSPAHPPAAVWLEDKYDGVRCQLHKVGPRVALYSRDLKDITDTFHDVAEAARQIPTDIILDGEILAMRGDEILSFAELQKRLGRREHDLFMREEVPIQFVAFDLLWLNGVTRLNEPLVERRRELEQLTVPPGLRLARITQAQSAQEIEDAFAAARGRNNEGLMAKSPASIYSPGRRGLSWLKLKKALATLDCVVVGAEYGHGKRSKVLSDYTFAVRDDRTGQLKTIGKAYSGLTDVEIAELTQHFLNRTLEKRGRFHTVVPDTVLEIAFDKIQESDRHTSGLAMRFPRIVRIRTDKTAAEIDTVASARRLVAT